LSDVWWLIPGPGGGHRICGTDPADGTPGRRFERRADSRLHRRSLSMRSETTRSSIRHWKGRKVPRVRIASGGTTLKRFWFTPSRRDRRATLIVRDRSVDHGFCWRIRGRRRREL